MTTIPGIIGQPFYENDLTVAGPVAAEACAALAGTLKYDYVIAGLVAAESSAAPAGGLGTTITATTNEFAVYPPKNSNVVLAGGSWTSASNVNAYGGFREYINTTGATCTITLAGDQFTIIGPKFNNYGQSSVTIDGVLQSPTVAIDQYNASQLYQQTLYTSPVLSPGTHTVVITSLGTKASSSTNYYIEPNAYTVTGVQLATATIVAPAGVVSCDWTVPGPANAVGLIPGLIGQPFYASASLETTAALPGTIGIGVPGPVANEPAAALVGTLAYDYVLAGPVANETVTALAGGVGSGVGGPAAAE